MVHFTHLQSIRQECLGLRPFALLSHRLQLLQVPHLCSPQLLLVTNVTAHPCASALRAFGPPADLQDSLTHQLVFGLFALGRAHVRWLRQLSFALFSAQRRPKLRGPSALGVGPLLAWPGSHSWASPTHVRPLQRQKAAQFTPHVAGFAGSLSRLGLRPNSFAANPARPKALIGSWAFGPLSKLRHSVRPSAEECKAMRWSEKQDSLCRAWALGLRWLRHLSPAGPIPRLTLICIHLQSVVSLEFVECGLGKR